MQLFLKTFLFFLLSFLQVNNAYALSNYQIKKICQKKLNSSVCIKNLKLRKSDLLKGNRIEIPVIPFKK